MGKIIAIEEMHLEKEWFQQAKKQTPSSLPGFVDHIMNDYVHDYGTVCHAIAACAIAAAWAANEAPGACGGITGFQAGFVMWDFVQKWSYPNNKTGLKILDYDEMLYPQCEDNFQKVISRDVWEAIKKEAQANLEKYHNPHPDVLAHWQSIVDGKVPFGFVVEEG